MNTREWQEVVDAAGKLLDNETARRYGMVNVERCEELLKKGDRVVRPRKDEPAKERKRQGELYLILVWTKKDAMLACWAADENHQQAAAQFARELQACPDKKNFPRGEYGMWVHSAPKVEDVEGQPVFSSLPEGSVVSFTLVVGTDGRTEVVQE